jgi:hypothetical protein
VQVTLALGDHLSLSTAGIVGFFSVTAKDAFGNRRPGGDAIVSLITLWDKVQGKAWDESLAPNTAKLVDYSDGSYGATYSITRGGTYQLTVSVGNVVGAGTPTLLVVKTGLAVPDNTYVYGTLLDVKAGTTSTLFVQVSTPLGRVTVSS